MSADAKQEPGKETPAAEQKPAAPVTPSAAPAASSGIDPEKFSALEKQLAKAQKELAATTERMKSPEFHNELLAERLGLKKDEDPKAKYSAAEAKASSLASENARLKAERAVEKSARALDFLDEDEHFDAARRAGVVADDYSVDHDALSAWFTKRKTDKPHLVRAAPAAAAVEARKGPPPSGKAPPAPIQPDNAAPPPKTNNAGAFSSFVGNFKH